ncbi:hypothetical protein GGS20DRAFT_379564 [Poronia punctata]|nr:hypothetical protein GGS20DRAFT_379564 [Poronia punctata]
MLPRNQNRGGVIKLEAPASLTQKRFTYVITIRVRTINLNRTFTRLFGLPEESIALRAKRSGLPPPAYPFRCHPTSYTRNPVLRYLKPEPSRYHAFIWNTVLFISTFNKELSTDVVTYVGMCTSESSLLIQSLSSSSIALFLVLFSSETSDRFSLFFFPLYQHWSANRTTYYTRICMPLIGRVKTWGHTNLFRARPFTFSSEPCHTRNAPGTRFDTFMPVILARKRGKRGESRQAKVGGIFPDDRYEMRLGSITCTGD